METSRRHADGGRAAAGESDDERINPATPGRLTGLMFSPFTVAPLGNCTRRRGGVFLGMNAEDFISLVRLSFAGGLVLGMLATLAVALAFRFSRQRGAGFRRAGAGSVIRQAPKSAK